MPLVDVTPRADEHRLSGPARAAIDRVPVPAAEVVPEPVRRGPVEPPAAPQVETAFDRAHRERLER